jgi:hypothetical protein
MQNSLNIEYVFYSLLCLFLGLGIFVGKFSLPALIFVSLCQLNLTQVNWSFLAAGNYLD